MELNGKVVLITGSSVGIGKEAAILFAKKGAKVVITYNKGEEEANKTLKECKKHTTSTITQLNVKDENSIKETLSTTINQFGKIDILVNNAGAIHWKNLEQQSLEEIDNQIQTNLTGLIKTTRLLLPHLIQQNEGMIINISSGAGKTGYSNLTTYCATKFGVRGFTQALAKELPNRIRVYCVNPGMTATRMTDFEGIPPEKVAEIIVKTAEETLNKQSGDDVDVWEYV